MKFPLLFILFAIVAVTISQAKLRKKVATKKLHCYVCEDADCKKLTDDMLEYCGPPTETATTEVITTTIASTESTLTPDTPTPSTETALVTSTVPAETSPGNRKARSDGVEYSCFKFSYKTGGNLKRKHGCVAVPPYHNACEFAIGYDRPQDIDDIECQACNENTCNSSAALQFSAAMLLAVISFKFLI